MSSFDTKLEALQKQFQDLATHTKTSHDNRRKLLDVLEYEKNQIQTARDSLSPMFMHAAVFAMLRAAIELKIPSILHQRGQSTAKYLASQTGADELLIVRIMRPLCAKGFCQEKGVESYANGPVFDLIATDPRHGHTVKFFYDLNTPCMAKYPYYLKSIGWKYVPPAGVTNFEYTWGKGVNLWSWLREHPETLTDFQGLLSAWDLYNPHGFHKIPLVQWIKDAAGESKSPVLWVDVGSGPGEDTELACEILQAAGAAETLAKDKKVRFILQDLPEVIAQVPSKVVSESPLPVELVEHDFFTPQPAAYQGAKFYYMHQINHDWPDEDNVRFLTQLRDAMTPGYSRLLINGWVLPEKGADIFASEMDINMASVFNAAERTEKQYRDLIARIHGLKIEKIWGNPEVERIIELSREA